MAMGADAGRWVHGNVMVVQSQNGGVKMKVRYTFVTVVRKQGGGVKIKVWYFFVTVVRRPGGGFMARGAEVGSGVPWQGVRMQDGGFMAM